jgi:hypothetical protein
MLKIVIVPATEGATATLLEIPKDPKDSIHGIEVYRSNDISQLIEVVQQWIIATNGLKERTL